MGQLPSSGYANANEPLTAKGKKKSQLGLRLDLGLRDCLYVMDIMISLLMNYTRTTDTSAQSEAMQASTYIHGPCMVWLLF